MKGDFYAAESEIDLMAFKKEYSVQASRQFASDPCLKYAVCHNTAGETFSGGVLYIASDIPADFLKNPLRSMAVLTSPGILIFWNSIRTSV